MVGKEGEAQKTIKETTEIRIDQGAIYRLNAYGWEARRYAAGLTQIRGNFSTRFQEQIDEHRRDAARTASVFSEMANALRDGQDIHIVPHDEDTQRLFSVSLKLSSQWIGRFPWKSLEVLLGVLFPPNKAGVETKKEPSWIRETLERGETVVLYNFAKWRVLKPH